MQHTYRVEDETTDMPCGFDFESFLWGSDCQRLAVKVIIEDKDFHFAHLCELHTVLSMDRLSDMQHSMMIAGDTVD